MKCIPVFALLLCLVTGRAAQAAPGDIISATPMAPPGGARAWKIVYRSTGLRGEAIAVSGVIIAPAAAGRNRRVIAWAHPTTGVAETCAPSATPNFFERIPDLSGLIAHGYVVAATDYPGLGSPGVHPYLIGESEARAVIDSVRAAQHLAAAGAGKRYVAWGHSQGGHAVLFVNQIARTYAPDLSLAGVAAISPPTQLQPILQDDITESTGRILTAYTVWSWSRIYDAPMSRVVRLPTAVPVIDAIAKTCAENKDDAYRLGLDAAWTTKRLIKGSIYTTPPWEALIAANSPLPSGYPYYIAQGSADPIVPAAQTARFASAVCRNGGTVQLDILQGEGHMKAAFASASHATAWIADRFAGRPAPRTC